MKELISNFCQKPCILVRIFSLASALSPDSCSLSLHPLSSSVSKLWHAAHGWNRNKPTAQLPAVSLSSRLHTHTIPPMPQSVQILQPFPPQTPRGPGQTHKIAMDLDPMNKSERQFSWDHNAQCQMHTVFLCIQHLAFCGGESPTPLALHRGAHAS